MKTNTNDQLSQLFTKSSVLEQRIKANDDENKKHRVEIEKKPATFTIPQLIPDITEEDLVDDTGADTIQVDPNQNPIAGEARMVTLNQLHKLFSVQLKRSNVRARLDKNDSDAKLL